jgi:hypothetical protein
MGRRKFINASETRSRREEVWEEMVLRGRYWA